MGVDEDTCAFLSAVLIYIFFNWVMCSYFMDTDDTVNVICNTM